MNLPDIQTNLAAIVAGVLAGQSVLVDDGAKETTMETALQDAGLTVLILTPQAYACERTRGAVAVSYTTTVWVRTNPKVLTAEVPTWNSLTIEAGIINAVMAWSKPRSDYGFTITPDMEPETDWNDEGNNSRLIRFSTVVKYS